MLKWNFFPYAGNLWMCYKLFETLRGKRKLEGERDIYTDRQNVHEPSNGKPASQLQKTTVTPVGERVHILLLSMNFKV